MSTVKYNVGAGSFSAEDANGAADHGGSVMATATLAKTTAHAQSLSEIIGGLVADTSADAIPAKVFERAQVSLLHNLSVGLAGRSREPVAHRMASTHWPAPATATLLWDGTRVSVEGAAFANAALMNARSQDDTHAGSTSHPGSPTMAAAMAVAEASGASGHAFLAAVVMGYEALGRIGRDFDQVMSARGVRPAAVLGGFGAAAATARLMALSASQTAHAIGLVTHLAAGHLQVWREGSAEAPLQLAFAARNGVSAARAAALGATAARFALEGPEGFYRAVADTTAEPTEALAGGGTCWQLDEVTVKPFPICAILQGPAGVVRDFAASHAIAPDQVAAITVWLNPYEAAFPGVDHGGPFASSIATKMSAQFSLALILIDGRITPPGLDRVTDPRVLALSHRVRVIADPTIPPRHSRVRLDLASGHSHEARVDAPVGQPTFAEAARITHDLAPEIGATQTQLDRLIDAVATIPTAPTVADLMAAAAGCCSSALGGLGLARDRFW